MPDADYLQNFLCLGRHSLQYTGLPSVGLNGTSVSTPQSEQVTFVISLGPLLPRKPPEFPLKFLSLKAIFVSPPLVVDIYKWIFIVLKTRLYIPQIKNENRFLITDHTSLCFQHIQHTVKLHKSTYIKKLHSLFPNDFQMTLK